MFIVHFVHHNTFICTLVHMSCSLANMVLHYWQHSHHSNLTDSQLDRIILLHIRPQQHVAKDLSCSSFIGSIQTTWQCSRTDYWIIQRTWSCIDCLSGRHLCSPGNYYLEKAWPEVVATHSSQGTAVRQSADIWSRVQRKKKKKPWWGVSVYCH